MNYQYVLLKHYSTLILFGCLIPLSWQHGNNNDQQQQKQEHNGGHKNMMHDSKHIQDKEHIKEHLKEQINVKEEQMSDADLQFHYFKVHDNDNDDKLDGIELANAMAHYHDEEAGEKPEDYTEEELASMVDQILDEDDLNKDGYIDYPEFIASQQREETESE
ncbi:multiple coagulation factor deficiency protein 2 homolog [Hydractinia symbiolongicarpus]|uniref:multiple coagulation factor deficiency protein 2 homolog n=1 Tax=Hydractinia symbiolongicarpus TaxID=13093 RepID=UPI00254D49D9|nr:multiple coagulation factor deficiency protein 2 homolog [Hydractinia symbiolongicarpus]